MDISQFAREDLRNDSAPQLRPAFWLFIGVLLARRAVPVRAEVQISEFMALNQFTTFRDEAGERSDWIELINEGAEAVSLNGWYLSDDAGDLRKWQFPVSSPAVTLQPGGRLVVFASDKNRKARANRLHTNFRLSSASGGSLALVRPDGLTIEHSYTSYPQQIQDVSYGLPSRRGRRLYCRVTRRRRGSPSPRMK